MKSEREVILLNIIQVEEVVKRYGSLMALDHVSLEVKEGEIFGLLGPNGSGKTTLINAILSLITIDYGKIEVYGQVMRPDAYTIKRRIGVVPQDIAVFEELSVYENIDYFCGLYYPDKKERKPLVEGAIAFAQLDEFRKFRPKQLSGGLLRRLNLACGIAHKPDLIFLDEPTVAIDPQSRNRILEGIEQLRQTGATVVYTTHYMEEVEQLCDRIVILDKGKTLVTGTTHAIKAMSSMGERVTVDVSDMPPALKDRMQAQSDYLRVDYHAPTLKIEMARGSRGLSQVLEDLAAYEVSYDRVFSELPTLNDVFLELTGKELRDHA